jgi:hypothetical protein
MSCCVGGSRAELGHELCALCGSWSCVACSRAKLGHELCALCEIWYTNMILMSETC